MRLVPPWLASAAVALLPAVAISQAPQTHRFTPTQFYTTYSFAHPPASESDPAIA